MIEYFEDEDNQLDQIANYLHKGKIIAWHQGKMEFGPRALGNRSILANPLISSIKDDINKISSIHESFIKKKINLSLNDKVESIFHEYKSILNEKLGHIQK